MLRSFWLRKYVEMKGGKIYIYPDPHPPPGPTSFASHYRAATPRIQRAYPIAQAFKYGLVWVFEGVVRRCG